MSTPVAQPIPQGDYVPARRFGALVFTSGMTPRQNGKMQYFGPVRKDVPFETYKPAVELSLGNALAVARAQLAAGEALSGILSLTVYIAAEAGFEDHAKIADFASAKLREELGQAGIGTRAAVGVATLPGNAPVEIQLVAMISS